MYCYFSDRKEVQAMLVALSTFVGKLVN